MKRYTVELTENAFGLDDFDTREEAEEYIRKQEIEDASDSSFEEGYYSIVDNETNECERIWNAKPDNSEYKHNWRKYETMLTPADMGDEIYSKEFCGFKFSAYASRGTMRPVLFCIDTQGITRGWQELNEDGSFAYQNEGFPFHDEIEWIFPIGWNQSEYEKFTNHSLPDF